MFVKVDPGVVEQLKRSHGVAQAKFHGCVYVLVGRVATLHHRNTVLNSRVKKFCRTIKTTDRDVRSKEAVDNEAGSVLAADGVLPDSLAPRRHGLKGVV